jgi:hypothetical protein
MSPEPEPTQSKSQRKTRISSVFGEAVITIRPQLKIERKIANRPLRPRPAKLTHILTQFSMLYKNIVLYQQHR